MATSGLFSAELGIFAQHREEWSLSHLGQFVAIQGDAVEGFFGTYSEAFLAGLQRFGVTREFLVKQVSITEPVYFIS
jgi:hypothetical protein